MRGSLLFTGFTVPTILPTNYQQTVNRKPNRKHIKYAMPTELLQIVMLLLIILSEIPKVDCISPSW